MLIIFMTSKKLINKKANQIYLKIILDEFTHQIFFIRK